MRAVRIAEHGGPEVLELTEVAVPAPQAGEVLVQVCVFVIDGYRSRAPTRGGNSGEKHRG
jgi:hypothetical protein